jgi:molybdate transport system substrate-binding protein
MLVRTTSPPLHRTRRGWLGTGVLAVVGAAGCERGAGATGPRVELHVAAAADLRLALEELAGHFERAHVVKVVRIFGSSGMLARQIEQGAPFDLFFSADEQFVTRLVHGGHILPESVRIYATGRLALVVRRGLGLSAPMLEDLVRPEVRRIAIANPEHAPYGRAAQQALERSGLWTQVQPRLVLGENIAQTLQFVQTENADAGLVAVALLAGTALPWTLVDQRLHAPLRQVAGVTRRSHTGSARAFLEFVLSRQGQAVLARYGFEPPAG